MEDLFSKFGLTVICTIVIAIWFWQANTKFKHSVDENPFGDYEQPNTASVLGVLGTFIGIAVGLFNFNPSPEAMHDSVTNLLSGMTTAFFTSIIGMGISLYFKNYQANAQKNFSKNNFVKPDSTIADLIQYLIQSDAEKSELLKKLTISLVGDGDSTVIGQMKIIKSDIRDEFKQVERILQANNENVIRELKDFGKTLAESNSKAFIEALNETMKDFNQKLTEHFGENFKQLNIAVGNLLEWQENYKLTIERITENLQTTFEGIDTVKNSVAEIEKSAASITKSSEQILNLIVTANMYEQKLRQVLGEIQTLGEVSRESAQDIVKFVRISCSETQNYTEQATQNVNSHVNSVADNLEEKMLGATNKSVEMAQQVVSVSRTSLKKIIEIQTENMKLLQQVANKYATEIQNYTEQATQNVNSHVNSVANNLEEEIQRTIYQTNDMTQSISATTNTALSKITDTTNQTIASMRKMSDDLKSESFKITSETISKMDAMMKQNEEDFRESLETLGKAMLQISNKFAQDYTPLAERLREIVRIAEQVKSKGGNLF